MKNSKTGKLNTVNPICIGTGLVALDVVIGIDANTPIRLFAGGSCGNVLSILSFFGWESYPVARLADNSASGILKEDLSRWNVKLDLITEKSDGSTPIIIHRIVRDKSGTHKHRFEFRNPEDGKYLPSYKPVLAKMVPELISVSPKPKVFYFDRINRGALDLARHYKSLGAAVFFEPSGIKDRKMFEECLSITDILKFSNERIPEFRQFFPRAQTFLEIETMGQNGLRYRCKGIDHWNHIPAFKVPEIVDGAGAGDWCSAGIIYHFLGSSSVGELSSENLESALYFGQALSAISCNFEGARGAMYKLTAVDLQDEARSIMAEGKVSTFSGNNPSHETKSANPRLTISSLYAHV